MDRSPQGRLTRWCSRLVARRLTRHDSVTDNGTREWQRVPDRQRVVTSSPIGTPLPIGSEGVTDPSVYGDSAVHGHGSAASACAQTGDIDTLESYAPGLSGLTYNETTGVWHYNWQTQKTLAGKCVELTLNLSGDSTTFKFVK